MKIFKRIKKWLSPPKSITFNQIEDLLDTTIRCIITEDFHLVLDEKKQFINAWIGNRYCPINFEIVTLVKHRKSAKNFVNYIRFQLREAGIEL